MTQLGTRRRTVRRRTAHRTTAALAGLVGLGLLPAVLAAPATAEGDSRPSAARPSAHLDLPTGFRPEGIATRPRRPVAFLGSRDNGDLLRLNLRTARSTVFSTGPGTPSLGLKLDRRGMLWVAGGTGGDGRVVSARTGDIQASYTFAAADTFVNDVVLTAGAAWFTDSLQAQLYRVPLADPPFGQGAVETLPLTGEWEQVAGQLNANGITATPDGRALLVVNTTNGNLYRVDSVTGVATEVDLGGTSLTNGDGMLLEGRTLFVVRNQQNRIVKLRMRADGTRGHRTGAIGSSDFDVPTTVARYRDRLVLPDARFSTPSATDFWVTALTARR